MRFHLNKIAESGRRGIKVGELSDHGKYTVPSDTSPPMRGSRKISANGLPGRCRFNAEALNRATSQHC